MLYDDVQGMRHRLRLELEQEDRCTPVARMLVCLRLDRASPPAFFFAFLKFVAFPCSSNPICVQNYFPIWHLLELSVEQVLICQIAH